VTTQLILRIDPLLRARRHTLSYRRVDGSAVCGRGRVSATERSDVAERRPASGPCLERFAWQGAAVLAIPTARPPGETTDLVGNESRIRPVEQASASETTAGQLVPVRALCRALAEPRSRRRIDKEGTDERLGGTSGEGPAQEMLDLNKPRSADLAPGGPPVTSPAAS
jgi:hypothetical protein